MCAPVLVAASMGVQAAGAIIQSNAARAAGKANQQQYDYIAQQNKQAADAAIARGEQQSNLAQFKGSQDAAKYGRDISELKGIQRAASAANGVGAGSVTAEDIATDTRTKEQLDQQAIRYNADLQSWSAKTGAGYEAWDYRNQSSLNTLAGKNARRAGNAASTASLIQGATSIAGTGLNLARLK